MSTTLSWLDLFFGPAVPRYDGADLPREPTVEYAGDGVSVADDPTNLRTVVTISGGDPNVSRFSGTTDRDGNIDPTVDIYTAALADGVYQITATVMTDEIVTGALTHAHGGMMRCHGSWRTASGVATLLCAIDATLPGGLYLLDTGSDEADMDLTVVVDSGVPIVRLTPTVFGLYRYQWDVEIRGPVV